MQYRAIYDKTVPADPPNDFTVEADTDDEAFALICDQQEDDGDFPMEDVVRSDGTSLWDEYNEWFDRKLFAEKEQARRNET